MWWWWSSFSLPAPQIMRLWVSYQEPLPDPKTTGSLKWYLATREWRLGQPAGAGWDSRWKCKALEEGESGPCLADCAFALPVLAFPGTAPHRLSSFQQPFPHQWVRREGGNALCHKTSQRFCLLFWVFPAVLQRNIELSLSSKAKSIITIQVNRSHSVTLKYTIASMARRRGSGGGRTGGRCLLLQMFAGWAMYARALLVLIWKKTTNV